MSPCWDPVSPINSLRNLNLDKNNCQTTYQPHSMKSSTQAKVATITSKVSPMLCHMAPVASPPPAAAAAAGAPPRRRLSAAAAARPGWAKPHRRPSGPAQPCGRGARGGRGPAGPSAGHPAGGRLRRRGEGKGPPAAMGRRSRLASLPATPGGREGAAPRPSREDEGSREDPG